MSFELLQHKIISTDLCIGCSLCARNCKHISMNDSEQNPKGVPTLTGRCIMTTTGLKCGYCYNNCPVVKKYIKKDDRSFFTDQQLIEDQLSSTEQKSITEIAQILDLSPMKVRYELLRLVKQESVRMEINHQTSESLFWR